MHRKVPLGRFFLPIGHAVVAPHCKGFFWGDPMFSPYTNPPRDKRTLRHGQRCLQPLSPMHVATALGHMVPQGVLVPTVLLDGNVSVTLCGWGCFLCTMNH